MYIYILLARLASGVPLTQLTARGESFFEEKEEKTRKERTMPSKRAKGGAQASERTLRLVAGSSKCRTGIPVSLRYTTRARNFDPRRCYILTYDDDDDGVIRLRGPYGRERN